MNTFLSKCEDISSVFHEKLKSFENVTLVINNEKISKGNLFLNSDYMVWNSGIDMFAVACEDLAAVGRSKFENDSIVNSVVFILDFYQKYEENELKRTVVEDTLIVSMVFDDQDAAKVGELYSEAMIFLKNATRRMVENNLQNGEDIDELAESDGSYDDDENWDGMVFPHYPEEVLEDISEENQCENDEANPDCEGQFSDN